MPYRGVSLPEDVAARVTSGLRDLPLEGLPGAEQGEAGQPLRLVGTRGETVALAVADPENGLVRVMAVADEDVHALDAAFFTARVTRARALRLAFGLDPAATAHRLVNGAGDGLPGFTVDLYGEYAVLCAYARGLLTLGRVLGEAVRAVAGTRGVVLKVRGRDTAAKQDVKQEILGEAPPAHLVAPEAGDRYEVHLLSGLNVGLFTDMREHRAGLARFVAGRRVLNAFSYTGSLSVVAARAGATAVTSVDLSSGVQRWARTNFELAGISPERHRFEVSDVGVYLKKAGRAGDRFEVIVLDPPTYSAARAASWSMKNDYPELISRACAVLAPDGILWLSANARGLGPLADVAADGFTRAHRTAQLLEVGSLPPDHPTALAQRPDRYLQVCLFRVA